MKINRNTVTPNLDHYPERTYKKIGKSIYCFSIVKVDIGSDNIGLEVRDQPLFVIELESDILCSLLMEDLYCGEYTGS